MELNKIDGMSMNIEQTEMEKLKSVFPQCFAEGKLDIDKLLGLCGEYIDNDFEKYKFEWKGKMESLKLAQKRSTGTLRPCKAESVNFDETQNLYIEGDNLEVLKLLQTAYYNKIKMIYIDPPYNTGNDFVYEDDFADPMARYKEVTSQTTKSNPETMGRYHTNWLNMMYPRLRLASNLLTDDGVIFISIDDNEIVNLKKICDEIFGEYNWIATLPTVMNLKGNQDEFAFAGTHEYTLVYAKNKSVVTVGQFSIDEEEIEKEWMEDEKGYYKKGAIIRATGTDGDRDKRPYMFYPVLIKEDKVFMIERSEYEQLYDSSYKKFNDEFLNQLKSKYESLGYIVLIPKQPDGGYGRWRWGFETMYENTDELIINNNGEISIYKKQRPSVGDIPSKKPKTLFYKAEYSSGNGTMQLSNMFGKRLFDNPKPLELIRDILYISTEKDDDIVLDFFSGSGTTAHALMDLNAKYNTHKKYILIQLPEVYTENSEAKKSGYNTLCDLAEERIRRAAKNIKEATGSLFDYGFRVYKVDDSNMKDIYYKPSELEQMNLMDLVSNIKEDRTSDDLLTQVILDLGLTLDMKIEEKNILNNKVFYVEDNSLVACFDDQVNIDIIDEICKCNPLKVVFKDVSFRTDKDKINLEERIKKLSPDTEINIL